jgi:hypothetical protein
MKTTKQLLVLVCTIITLSVAAQQKAPGVKSTATKKGMTLQMDFVVTKEKSADFEKMYRTIYVPALKTRNGYLGSKLIRIFPDNYEKEILGESSTYNYQIQLYFATEADRKLWVASPIHVKKAWPSAQALAKTVKWRGYDVVDDDNNRK